MIVNKKLILALIFFCGYRISAQGLRPLNILFVVDYFPSLSQVYILNIMAGLLDRGHNVSIFAFRHNTSDRTLHPKVRQYKLLHRVMYEKLPDRLLNYDIVFCQFGDLGQRILEMEELSEWLQQRKVVTCLRGFDVAGYANNPPDVNSNIFTKTDLFLPVCNYFKERLITLGCDPEKIMVHHSAVDCSKFFFREIHTIKNKRIECISVCRLVEKKGLDVAIQAIADVAKKYRNIHFTIVGRGRLRPILEKLVKKLDIVDKVSFFGWATQDQIIDLLSTSHIFLLSSITAANGDEEGIANALKEAMAMGLISIGTFHAGTPELIEDGISGFLVPEKNKKALAKKIEYIINHPQEWKSIARAARKKIEDEFETKSSIKKLEKIFYALLDD